MTSAQNIRWILLSLLVCVAAVFSLLWCWKLSRKKAWSCPSVYQLLVGFITDFLDTLGIGSFATTTTLLRLGNGAVDEHIPGTLNVGHSLPTITEALIFMALVKVEGTTLVVLIAASVLGAWLGAGVVTRLPREKIQIGMGIALLAAAALIIGKLLHLLPSGGDSLELNGQKLAIGIAGSFLFGALMTIGIGAYAPIMVMVSLLGMNPKAAFPIMMGACAFLMPISGLRFVRRGKYDARASLGLTVGGIPGVLLAAPYVEKMSLDVVFWLVVVVVIYTAASLLHSAWRGNSQPTTVPYSPTGP